MVSLSGMRRSLTERACLYPAKRIPRMVIVRETVAEGKRLRPLRLYFLNKARRGRDGGPGGKVNASRASGVSFPPE